MLLVGAGVGAWHFVPAIRERLFAGSSEPMPAVAPEAPSPTPTPAPIPAGPADPETVAQLQLRIRELEEENRDLVRELEEARHLSSESLALRDEIQELRIRLLIMERTRAREDQ